MDIKKINEPVASNVQKIIAERCLKQCAIAKKAGYTPDAFCSMLKGRKIIKPCDTVKIAGALEVEPGELYIKN